MRAGKRQTRPERYILGSTGKTAKRLETARRTMLRLMMAGPTTKHTQTTERTTAEATRAASRRGARAVAAVLAAGLLMAGAGEMRAQNASVDQQTPSLQLPSRISAPAKVTYDNKYEVYGGLNFMNFQAGQSLPKRMNLGGGELLGTYWLNRNLGLALNYRGEAGTTPVFPGAQQDPYNISRPLVYMNMLMVGAQYRGPKNQFVAIDYHGFIGAAKGVFDASRRANQPLFYPLTGLYTNRTKPVAAVGGSLDINLSKRTAVRLSPDLIFEHFGTETREFFAISGGLVYRFGKQ